MLTPNDLKLLTTKGIHESQINEQLSCFKHGFPFLEIITSASVNKGIMSLSDEEQQSYICEYNEYLASGRRVIKFVPASGAASRMFKDLYAFLEAPREQPATESENVFFERITNFAFYDELNDACLAGEGKSIKELVATGRYKAIISRLLNKEGLNYGGLPKGLLLFHRYDASMTRTAFEEHLAEGALYAKAGTGDVNIHFTVLPEHEDLFHKITEEKLPEYEARFTARYNISFDCQKPSTDTLAADMDNQPFRDRNGGLVFRPGGHGALIENLNDMDSDIVFIKNVDNVAPDGRKAATVTYKKLLAGILVSVQRRIFNFLNIIDSGQYTRMQIEEMIHFLHDVLYIRSSDMKHLEDAELILFLKGKLNRPIRICGMVRNEGEPGGGPFIAVNPDGTVSPQILESSQIDLGRQEMKALFDQGTHFNPVDLVCAIKDYQGNKFNLRDYIDANAGFISTKSKDGRELKALELPGLWNGAMSDWNTIFVEVPIETFSPVKTVFDLLRPEHQG
ncbi:MAG: DUF4301 family protein [Tannerellaceae bacterium]|jgi:hypothetical protein|nr:DUF4301 family protein [Tannerellaceae bacterium]